MLQNGLPQSAEKYDSVNVTVPSHNEFRVVYSFARNVFLRLIDGAAEISGAQITYSLYQLPADLKSLSLYTRSGCVLQLISEPETLKELRYYCQPDDEGYFNQLFALNAILEAHRQHSFTNLLPGPRVLVIGSESAGKMTLIRTLINYAVKNQWRPIFADMDPFESTITPLASVSATTIVDFMPYSFEDATKLSYFFGYDSLKDGFEIYAKQIKCLNAQISKKIDVGIENFKSALIGGVFLEGPQQRSYFEFLRKKVEKLSQQEAEQVPNGIGSTPKHIIQPANQPIVTRILSTEPAQAAASFPLKIESEFIEKDVSASGVFYNLPNEISLLKSNEIQQLIDTILPDYVVVIASDYLRHEVQNAIKNKNVTFIKFPKNGGVSFLDSTERRRLKEKQVNNFFRSEAMMYKPENRSAADINVYQIDSPSNLPLKYFTAVIDQNLIVSKVDFSIHELKDRYAGILNFPVGDKVEIDDILTAELLALVCIRSSDTKVVTLTRPQDLPEGYHKYIMCLCNFNK